MQVIKIIAMSTLCWCREPSRIGWSRFWHQQCFYQYGFDNCFVDILNIWFYRYSIYLYDDFSWFEIWFKDFIMICDLSTRSTCTRFSCDLKHYFERIKVWFVVYQPFDSWHMNFSSDWSFERKMIIFFRNEFYEIIGEHLFYKDILRNKVCFRKWQVYYFHYYYFGFYKPLT